MTECAWDNGEVCRDDTCRMACRYSGKCTECGKGIGHFLFCNQHPDYSEREALR